MRYSIACIGLNSDILNMREQSISTKLSFVRSFHYAQVNGFKDGEKLDDNLMDRHNLCNAAKKNYYTQPNEWIECIVGEV